MEPVSLRKRSTNVSRDYLVRSLVLLVGTVSVLFGLFMHLVAFGIAMYSPKEVINPLGSGFAFELFGAICWGVLLAEKFTDSNNAARLCIVTRHFMNRSGRFYLEKAALRPDDLSNQAAYWEVICLAAFIFSELDGFEGHLNEMRKLFFRCFEEARKKAREAKVDPFRLFNFGHNFLIGSLDVDALPDEFFEAARRMGIDAHGSILPKWNPDRAKITSAAVDPTENFTPKRPDPDKTEPAMG